MPSLLRITIALVVTLLVTPGRPVGAQQTSDPPERIAGRLLVRGMTRAFLGDDRGAIGLFSEALRLTPDDASLLGAMAEAHHRIGNEDDAAFFAQRATVVRPDRIDPGLLLVGILQASGDLAGALKELDRLTGVFPDDTDVLRARAETLVLSEQWSSARDAYRLLADRLAGDTDALLNLVDLEAKLGNLDAALEALDRLDALAPGEVDVALRRGRILVHLDRDPDAIRAFERVLDLAPGHVEAREALGALGVETDRTTEIVRSPDDWLKAVADDPRSRDNWIMAVRTLAREGRTADALRTSGDALLLFPGSARLEIEAGLAAILAAMPEIAIAHFDAGLRDLAERPANETNLETVALAGRWLATSLTGVDVPEPDISGHGPDDRALMALALAAVDAERATAIADAALADDPEGPLQLAAAAEARRRGNRSADALDLLSNHVHSDPVAPLVLLVMGDVLAGSGRIEDARQAWLRAADSSPGSPLVRARLGRP